FRSMLGVEGSLPSTKFTIESTGNIVILGTNGDKRTKTDGAKMLQVIGADNKTASADSDYLYILYASCDIRAATKDAAYSIAGTGNGHGVGLSQYGAYALAKQGYDYQYILKYYYTGTTISKE